MQIDDITYQDILAARETLIESGLNRNTINQRVGIWRRFFSWALDNRLCSPQTKSEVLAVDNLKRGRTLAPDGDPVRPVPHVMVKRTIQFMPPNLRAMVQIQELCGARPDEMCSMRPCDIEQRRAVWVYRPEGHKTKHNGKCRVICLGPRAQRQLAGLLEATGPKRFIFNPAVATQERSNVWSQAGDRWTASNYGQAVRNAIKAAHKASVEVDDWSPNQLRHSCGTRVRRKFGPDAASAVLGHSTRGGARITDTYTIDAIERETITIASRPMQAIG
jgi:integrase